VRWEPRSALAKSPRAKMQKPRALGHAITRLVPPDCLAGLGKSVSYDEVGKRDGDRRKKKIGNRE